MIKLYTEEEVRNILNRIVCDNEAIDEYIDRMTPIELPSRDMAEEAFTNSCLSDSKEGNIDFINGFIWTVRQILN